MWNDVTPVRNNAKSHRVQPDPEEAKAEQHYLDMAAKLEGYVQYETFEDIIALIVLTDAFNQYSTTVGDRFDSLAMKTSGISGGKISHYGELPVKFQESEVMNSFINLYKAMEARSTSLDKTFQLGVEYMLVSHQNRAMAGSQNKPDAILYYPKKRQSLWLGVYMIVEAKLVQKRTPEGTILVQMDAYALEIWKSQPTRTFVPVLYPNGSKITFLVFSRNKCYYAVLGDFIRGCSFNSVDNLKAIRRTIKQMRFLIIQQPKRFEQNVDVSKEFNYLEFTRITSGADQSSPSVDVIAEPASSICVNAVGIRTNIHPNAKIVRRPGHLFKCWFCDSMAFLKL